MRRHSLHLLAALCGSTLCAQQLDTEGGFNCLANHPAELQRHLDAHPGALEQAQAANALLDARTQELAGVSAQRQVYPISVVVHIIHNNGPENISDAQVYDAIRILNEDFNKENPDWVNVRPEFIDLVGDVGIQFFLAKRDPWGNCTNGITRTESPMTMEGSFEMTQLIQWPRDRYMNIWVCANAGGAAGYTYYPMWLDSWPEADGMVVRSDYVGSIGTSNPQRSRVISHEVGHWLNLKHCWGDSNEPGSEENCWMDDDVTDTPLTKGWTSCFLIGNSCGSELDNVENYMEYSYCDKMFTHGQADRMIAALTSPIAQRDQLSQTSTLMLTGVLEDVGLCVADFTHGATQICTGGTVQFNDVSYHGVSSRLWSFPGGTPTLSSDPSPVVTYNEPGTYEVGLVVGDGTNSDAVVRPGLVRVFPATGSAVPWSESFEEPGALAGSDWLVVNPDNDQGWQQTDLTAFTGVRSVRLLNDAWSAGKVDQLLSTTFDMSAATGIHISFRYAFARRLPTNDDRLRLYVSNDCGATWSLRRQLRAGVDLATGGTVAGSFMPTNGDQWGYTEVNNISANYHSPDFRIRFEFLSDGGNNVYLDDININGMPVGLEELNAVHGGLLVVPNPADATDGTVQLLFELQAAGTVQVDVLDALGRTVSSREHGRLPAGPQRVELPLSGISAGGYMVRVRMPGAVRTTRLVVR